MIRSRLTNCFNKTRFDEKWSLYKTKTNFGPKLLKTKKDYFTKVNQKLVFGQ